MKVGDLVRLSENHGYLDDGKFLYEDRRCVRWVTKSTDALLKSFDVAVVLELYYSNSHTTSSLFTFVKLLLKSGTTVYTTQHGLEVVT